MAAEILDAATGFTQQQPVTRRQAAALGSARQVDTGDPGLDQLIADTMDVAGQVWTALGQAFAATGEALTDAVDTYQSMDGRMAAAYDDLSAGREGSA